MNKRLLKVLQYFLVVQDFFLLNIIYLFLCNVYGSSGVGDFLGCNPAYWLGINIIWFLLSGIGGLYAQSKIQSFYILLKRTLFTCVIWALCVIIFLYTKVLISSNTNLFKLLVIGVALYMSRFAYIGLYRLLKRKTFYNKNIVIIGYNEVGKKLANYLQNDMIGMNVLGFIEDGNKVAELSNYPILADIKGAIPVSEQLKVKEIYSTISPEQDTNLLELVQQAEDACIRFRYVPDFSLFYKSPVHIRYIKDLPVLSIWKNPLDNINNRIAKRMLDLIVSTLVIILVLSWLIPILGLLIYIESPGPIFFKQARTGRDKKTFKCLKFRSMKCNAESDTKQATKHDDRITSIGRFIRKTSIDEFPQFINVFLGEMSLVGPRPHMVKHTESFSKTTHHYMIRQFLKPGITGWAQINGLRGEISQYEQLEKRVKHDLWYMENWSLWLDLKIMILTVYNLIKGDSMAF